ncbi:phage baseplate plug family protein [Methylobacillus sp.]|mgnify:CR=1 FL=1|uniref:phage baseplate plug family protein n=1 Tax=Methylobacillus sp. TaxID=56818 RepID=UPI002FE1A44F
MIVIPLASIPNQRLSFQFEEEEYALEVNLRRGSLYITAWKDGENLVNNRVLRSYAPLPDGFIMVDTEGVEDPTYEQLGTRFLLLKDNG